MYNFAFYDYGLSAMLLLLIGFAIFGFTIWMFIEIIVNPKVEMLMKIVWLLAIIGFGPIGAGVYYFIGYRGNHSANKPSDDERQ